ncbi:DUF5986 family protein [Bacillus sp. Marseille-P3800]|uniref:DUF5986 family protein n=1 Tax=Bacillus sp. Marseille-P3800 TaxID=2014782 RepID=UPI000C07FC70|nr:DUF5986 family protein [Bacillus sp. Marseille-P3800]
MSKIEVSDDFKMDLSSVIGSILTNDLIDYKKLNDLRLQNGIHFFFWDKVYTAFLNGEIKESVPIELDAAIWQFCGLICPDSKTLFTVVKDKRLNELIRDYGKKSVPHYSYVFNGFNPSANDVPNIKNDSYQLEILPLEKDPEWMKKILDRQKELLGTRVDEIEKHVIVTIENKGKEIIGFKAYLFSKEMIELDSQDWSDFIVPIIDNDKVEKETQHEAPEEEPNKEDTLVKLKVKKKSDKKS